MLKRITNKYTSEDKSQLDMFGYMPTEQEIERPSTKFESLSNAKHNFQGKHQCSLCPTKVIADD